MSDKSFLIVDDDDDIRLSMALVLESEGYNIVTATNGLEALDLLRSKDFQNDIGCIILDLMMPTMNGVEFIAAFPKELPEAYQQIPIIVATAKGNTQEPENIPAHIKRIKKPMDIDELFQAVRETFRA